jgi:hypothetical protein
VELGDSCEERAVREDGVCYRETGELGKTNSGERIKLNGCDERAARDSDNGK